MPISLDQLMVLLAIAAAAGYLAWRSRRKASGCGSCSGNGCGSGEKPDSGTLVQLEVKPTKRPRAR